MRDAERYRDHAEECRIEAAKSISPLDKEQWLKLAADWLILAQRAAVRETSSRKDRED